LLPLSSNAERFPYRRKKREFERLTKGNSPSLLSAVVMNAKVFYHFFGGVYLPLFLHEKAPFLSL